MPNASPDSKDSIWARRFREVYETLEAERNAPEEMKAALAEQFADKLQVVLKRLSSGDVDEDWKRAGSDAWKVLLAYLAAETEKTARKEAADPGKEVEEAYLQFQGAVIEMRQAVAQAIATQQELERNSKKLGDQIETWQARALEAQNKGSAELTEQANIRVQQYEAALVTAEQQLAAHREAVMTLRNELTIVETDLQKCATSKQLLKSRYNAAEARIRVLELKEELLAKHPAGHFSKFEEYIDTMEAQAQAKAEDLRSKKPDVETECDKNNNASGASKGRSAYNSDNSAANSTTGGTGQTAGRAITLLDDLDQKISEISQILKTLKAL